MLAVIAALVPVFLLIATGLALRRWSSSRMRTGSGLNAFSTT
jgi:predicted permease